MEGLAHAQKMKELRELYSSLPQRASAEYLRPRRLEKARPVHWRYADRPRSGTIYDLPDDLTLQRGITYTFLPDGKAIRVPAMNRLNVRAAAQGHQEDEDGDMKTSHWELKEPCPSYLACFAVGEFIRQDEAAPHAGRSAQ